MTALLKHIEDDGELALFVNDSGAILLVCQSCKRRWQVPTQEAAALSDLGLAAETHSAVESLRAHPEILADSPISLEDFD